MKVAHIGAGNIGRGFILPVLQQDKKIEAVTFFDVNQEMIDKINLHNCYHVIELDVETKTVLVQNVFAKHTNWMFEKEAKEFFDQVSLITISVGKPNLKKIVKNLEHLISNRSDNNPLIVIAAENGIRVTSYLKSLINPELKNYSQISFVDAIIDRISWTQMTNSSADVEVEKYYSWTVDNQQWPVNFEKISSIKYSDQLDAEIRKKLVLLNGVHAAICWHRYQINQFEELKTMPEVINLPETQSFIKKIYAQLIPIVSKQCNFTLTELEQYTNQVIQRFNNPKLRDELSRIARNPITKLQKNERILDPLFFGKENNIPVENLFEIIKDALNFCWNGDQESQQLSTSVQENGIKKTLKKYIDNLTDEEIDFIENGILKLA